MALSLCSSQRINCIDFCNHGDEIASRPNSQNTYPLSSGKRALYNWQWSYTCLRAGYSSANTSSAHRVLATVVSTIVSQRNTTGNFNRLERHLNSGSARSRTGTILRSQYHGQAYLHIVWWLVIIIMDMVAGLESSEAILCAAPSRRYAGPSQGPCSYILPAV